MIKSLKDLLDKFSRFTNSLVYDGGICKRLIRINNIKRLFNILPDEIIKISPNIYLDRLNLFIKKDKKEIHLAKKECEILLYLINNNKTVSIEELSTNVWSYEDSPNASTVRTYIKNLRKILGEEFISNTRGVGYRFNK